MYVNMRRGKQLEGIQEAADIKSISGLEEA
jgi:hypothetical protein